MSYSWLLLCVIISMAESQRLLHVYMDPDPFAISNNTILNFIPTFEAYLNQEIGNFFIGNITFKLHHYDGSIPIDELVTNGMIDFFFGAPQSVACLQATYFANPLATVRRALPTGISIDGYGGSIVTRATNSKINSLKDLEGKVIGIQLQSGWASNILQQGLLIRNGINIFRDAKQIISGDLKRDYTQLRILQDIHAGILDVGFIRADNLYLMDARNQTRMSYFKVIAGRRFPIPGTAIPYPFNITTALYPEWGIASLPSVSSSVRWAVLNALLALNGTSPAARRGNYDSWEPAVEYAPALQASSALARLQH